MCIPFCCSWAGDASFTHAVIDGLEGCSIHFIVNLNADHAFPQNSKPKPFRLNVATHPLTLLLVSQKLLDLLLDTLLLLGLGGLLGLVLLGNGLPLVLALLGSAALGLLEGVLTDGGVSLSVQVLKTLSLDVGIDVLLELALVTLLVVVGQGLHVLGDVAAVDVLAENLGVELLGLHVVSGESLLGVGNQDATVGGALHGTEDAGTGGGAGKTNIEEGLEGAALAVVGLSGLGEGELAVSLLDTDEVLVEAQLAQGTAGNQETGGVGGSPVGKTLSDAVGLQLVGVGRDEDLVTSDLGGDDLHDDTFLVREANDEAVLGRIVLVLGLGDEALASVVVGLALASALVLRLVATVVLVSIPARNCRLKSQARGYSPEVGAVLNQLVERLS